MRGSVDEDQRHSTDTRPRPWLRVILSLGIFGFLIGLMIGRLLQPDPLRLDRVETADQALQLWFNVEPQLQATYVSGTVILRFEAFGREREGQLRWADRLANWRVTRERRDLVLRVVAARPLRAEWRAEAVDGEWRLTVSLLEQ
ncbi:MAG: hypothetical protein KJ884_06810 [Gammaproteobacteria bacterium]|jgi:hypothetical protein|nr:hypothetical protein [Gammaproteobacteria bacterium]MBU1531267.1 hypothetical protein [Gammaproteobacteria bacterium]MBU2067338.1 hypothetical protein [Gammaproteobacteria bacterium]MBU2154748.1 hypothetical protein [Gammaproteobacteria bacterium]MBU2216564.1 hypothetical protein [Gammaproteobacteria bacterium]